MTDKFGQDLLSRYTDGDQLSATEISTLVQNLSRKKSLADEFINDLSLHRLILFMRHIDREQDDFVTKCVTKYGAEFLEDDEFSIVTKHKAVTEQSADAKGKRAIVSVKNRQKRAKWAVALLAFASVFVFGWFVTIIWNSNANRITSNDNEIVVLSNEPNFSIENPVEAELPSLPNVVSDAEPKPAETKHSSDLEDGTKVVPDVDGFFARVASASDAIWSGKPPGNLIGAGALDLIDGIATIEMSSDVTIKLVGPAKIELVSESKLAIESGRIVVDSTGSEPLEFVILGRDAMFNKPSNAKTHFFVDDNGTEVVVSQGELQMTRRDDESSSAVVKLAIDAFSHAYINNISREIEPVTPIMVAHGRGKYFGQMGLGQDKSQFSSPDEFEQKLNSIIVPKKSASSELTKHVEGFNRMFRQVRKQFESGDVDPSAASRLDGYSFQGEIIVDGDNVEFSSEDLNDFTHHLRQHLKGSNK